MVCAEKGVRLFAGPEGGEKSAREPTREARCDWTARSDIKAESARGGPSRDFATGECGVGGGSAGCRCKMELAGGNLGASGG